MKKLLFISILLVAFACSKDDEGDNFADPIVGTWTKTYDSFVNKVKINADGTAKETGDFTGECLFVWKPLQVEKMERMMYKFTYCGFYPDNYNNNFCDEEDVWQRTGIERVKWVVDFNEDFSSGDAYTIYLGTDPNNELSQESDGYWIRKD